jgi:hypothetical protein
LTGSLLLVTYFKPCRGHAGGLRLLDLYAEIRRLAPRIRIVLLACEHPGVDWGLEELDRIFDEVHGVTPDRFVPEMIASLPATSGSFDFVDLQFHQSGAMIGACRARWPGATIAFSPMESRIRSLAMGWRGDTRQVLGRLRSLRLGDLRSAWQEAIYLRRCDRTILVSEPDLEAVARLRERRLLHCVPTGLSEQEYRDGARPAARLEASVIAFAAYFGSQTNRTALEWYCTSVHPKVRAAVPDCVLKVVGRGLDEPLVQRCSGAGIEFVGQVDVMHDTLVEASLGIAPALSGAGVRGKIHQYAALGLPCVASALARDGLDYEPGKSILVASDADDFAAACVYLLGDPAARRRMGEAARQTCDLRYRWSSMAPAITRAYQLA